MLAVTVVNVLFPTPPFWLEKAMNFVLFVASISILFLSFYFPCTACRPALNRAVIPAHRPAVLIQFHLSGLPSFVQSAVPSFRLSQRQDRWLACRPACWNGYRIVFMPSGIPACHAERCHAFRHSCTPSFRIAIGSGCLQTGLRD